MNGGRGFGHQLLTRDAHHIDREFARPHTGAGCTIGLENRCFSPAIPRRASATSWSFASHGTFVLRLRGEDLDLVAPGLPMKASQDKINSRAYALDASRTKRLRTAVQT